MWVLGIYVAGILGPINNEPHGQHAACMGALFQCPCGKVQPAVFAVECLHNLWMEHSHMHVVVLCFAWPFIYGRLILILIVVQSRGAVWLLEQPITSLLYLHDRFKWLENITEAGCVGCHCLLFL